MGFWVFDQVRVVILCNNVRVQPKSQVSFNIYGYQVAKLPSCQFIFLLDAVVMLHSHEVDMANSRMANVVGIVALSVGIFDFNLRNFEISDFRFLIFDF